jgi:hypothetical protein
MLTTVACCSFLLSYQPQTSGEESKERSCRSTLKIERESKKEVSTPSSEQVRRKEQAFLVGFITYRTEHHDHS